MILFLRNGTRIDIGDRTVTTTLPSGARIHACPQGNAAQLATAHELGYGDDVEAMTHDHDPLHSLVAAWLGLPASLALRDAAREMPVEDRHLAELEERAVIALQALARATGVSIAELASRLA